MDMADLVDAFKDAIIIDNETKTIWIIKDKKCKTYSKRFYDEFIKRIDLTRNNKRFIF